MFVLILIWWMYVGLICSGLARGKSSLKSTCLHLTREKEAVQERAESVQYLRFDPITTVPKLNKNKQTNQLLVGVFVQVVHQFWRLYI